jgi:hypothetical protein
MTAKRDVASRAAGRPPEEAHSDDAEGQATAILEESEERVDDGAARSTGAGESLRSTDCRDNGLKSG